MDKYNADFRENDPIFLIRQSQELVLIAKSRKNSSAIIYASLDMRIALEILDLQKVLLSVDLPTRFMILEDSKPKNGIDKVGKRTGSLKEKYQMFYQAVCEIANVNDKYYDFKKSKELQHKLSTYIHSYYMSQNEINFNSILMQNAFSIISESQIFIKNSLEFDGKEYSAYGLNISEIPEEDKIILQNWKDNKIDYEDLKKILKENINSREKK